MTQRKGRCTNFGNCGTADTKQTILTETADFVCPDCSKQLTEIASAGKSRFSPLAIGLFILAIAVVGLFELWPRKNQEAAPVAAKSAATVPIVILRLHGSNTIGAQLAPALAEGFLKAQGATDIRVVFW
jgi:phosphate transport system substrate-binding protein